MIKNTISFCCGYRAVRLGLITKELTNAEIEKRWPQHNIDAFAQSVLDGLKGDSRRYQGLLEGQNNDE